jgi:signal transduction histidine kinase
MSAPTRWLRPPPAADAEEALRAQITHWIVLTSLLVVSALELFVVSIEREVDFMLGALLAFQVGAIVSFVLLHTGHIRAAGSNLVLLALLFCYMASFAVGGVRSPQLATAVLVIVVTGFLVGTRAAIWIAFATSVSLLGLVVGREMGLVPEGGLVASPYTTWAALTVVLSLAAVFLHIFVGAMNAARQEAAEKSVRLEEEMKRREEAEASLVRAEKLEALGRLTGGIAHDFNNILTVLLAESQLLESHAAAGRPLSSEELEQIAEIRRSSERAAALTSQLLSFARQRVGTPSAVDPDAAIRQLEPMLQRLIREDIELEAAPLDARGFVCMDPAQFDQVVMNLVLNARDAVGGSGRIAVSTGAVDVDESFARLHADATPGPHVVVEVSDTGEGIAVADLDRIFDPFFTTKDQGRGTGLGLASVHGIVTQAGGHITVESSIGRGARFRVHLPRVADVAARATAASPDGSNRPTRRILMCEDDAAVRQLVRRLLDQQDYDVLEAETPARAIELAREHRGSIDLVLSDIVMPVMNGIQLVRAVREIQPGVPALLVSGYAAGAVGAEGLGDDCAFLEKPFSPAQLYARLHDLLG